jgi:alpha-glucosidase/alpha-D-xyloside xylohydrolase
MTRRNALQSVTTALLTRRIATSQEQELIVAAQPVEIACTPVSPRTVRIAVQAIDNDRPQPIPSDGALVKNDWGQPVARLRTPNTVKSGELTVAVSSGPMIQIKAKDGRLIQELKFDPTGGGISFHLGNGPILGLGQGGPQFDRRGNLDRMVSGQGGYRLQTHGGKVPIQFIIGASGWAMFVHYPLGAFDLTGKVGLIKSADQQAALPFDIFVIAETDPLTIMSEYAKLTGHPEMAPALVLRLSAVSSNPRTTGRNPARSQNLP